MENNSMSISLSYNSSSSGSESGSSSAHRGSSSQPRHRLLQAPPPAVNQTALMTPPSKKPRGRPPGSKNKPKPASIPVAQSEPTVKLVIVNVPSGRDVIEYIIGIAHRGRVSISILSASGNIASVSLRRTPYGAPPLTLNGPFTLLSLTGSYLYNNQYTLRPGVTPFLTPLSFGISLSTIQGQVFGGAIGGRVIANNDVTIVLSTFRNPDIYKVIPESGYNNNNNNNNYRNNPNDFGGNMSGFNIISSEIPGC